MTTPSNDPSVNEEPHLRGGPLRPDPSEERADRRGREAGGRPRSEQERLEHTVWDEPGVSPLLAGTAPPGELTYGRWVQQRRGQTTAARSWAATLGIALAAGPWAILGAFWGSGQTAFSVLALVFLGPLVEETMKTALALYVVEKKPFLFRSRVQIAACVLGAAFVFAALENLLYLNVYVAKPTPGLIRWRWSVCVAMHMGCTLVAGLGLMRIWKDVWQRLERPRLALGYPYVIAAVVVHGAYNTLALILSAAGFTF